MTIDLRAVRERLTSPLLSDAIEALGGVPRCLGHDVAPLLPGSVVAGWAFPVRLERVDERPDVPYRGLLAALDAVGADEVFVVPTGRATDVAVWGELLSTSCQARGAAGAVTDGLVRDTRQVRGLGFPVFATGTLPLDINGRFEVVAHRVPAEVDGVGIEPGDLIFGDSDGVLVITAAEADTVVADALAKADGESRFRAAVAGGMLPGEAYERFGVL
ncbi:RraA family protein [Georgenia alba]|uniref:Putative 4-hydroxy-4-methyl-2-oxoglutarate aldolase n=1 Tax=Georgenia alba TaxID=2233858 RepID=A0ABW2Q5X9_9MICO